MIKAIIFDADGVIYNSEPLIKKAVKKVFAEQGITLTNNDFIPFFGLTAKDELLALLKKHKLHMPLEKALKKRGKYYGELLHNIRIFAGVKKLMKKIRIKKMKLAIATNSRKPKLYLTLKRLKLYPHKFDAIITAEQVKKHKPYPDVYLKAARRIKVKPADCLVFEDSLNGVKAAKAAGMYCVAITNSFSRKKLLRAGADLVLRSLTEVTL